jgi:hypothetical protein
MIWQAYTGAQLLPPQFDTGLEEIGRRYNISGLGRTLISNLEAHVEATEMMGLSISPDRANQQMMDAADAIGASTALELLPDEEFLTAYQDALVHVAQYAGGRLRAHHMLEHAERVFTVYGLPYRVEQETITWAGDGVTRTEVIEPVLAALDDSRVSGARAEFVAARAALRGGTADDLRDATHEAANAVEAVLLALVDAHGVVPPRARTATPLFNALRDAGKLPASLEATVTAAPRLRNAQGGHSQGPVATPADPALAQSAVGAAAVAITALVGYLPHR